MKLSKLYSNQSSRFSPVKFNEGFNAVLGQIRLPGNRLKDTHNLGKTTLGRLIDFSLLSRPGEGFFLYKHADQFNSFVFFLEIELSDSTYVTIRRGVDEPSIISMIKHGSGGQDFTSLEPRKWDHDKLSIDKARTLLDGLLNLSALEPWGYRKGLGYLLRTQDDYGDVFRLGKFAGKHADWKPFLAHLLGFDSEIMVEHYKAETDLELLRSQIRSMEQELVGSIEDLSKIEGLLLLKEKECTKRQEFLDAFDFRFEDKERSKELVSDLESDLSEAVTERYYLNLTRKKILAALKEDVLLFDINEAERLFSEVGVYFTGQIRKDYEQLLEFNRAITDERRKYLEGEKQEVEARVKTLNGIINELGKRRKDLLSYLADEDTFSKYKSATDLLVGLKADIASLARKRDILNNLQGMRKKIRALEERRIALQGKIEVNVESGNTDKESVFSQIRIWFSDIVREVIGRNALLSAAPNQLGHVEFKAEILDESGGSTSADFGHTYRKLLCVAFDLAVLRGHLSSQFPRFVFHDGILESLDDRKKQNLMAVLRKYSEMGIQIIITAIDSDVPSDIPGEGKFFEEDEIILVLHDENEDGRLFKMRSW